MKTLAEGETRGRKKGKKVKQRQEERRKMIRRGVEINRGEDQGIRFREQVMKERKKE